MIALTYTLRLLSPVLATSLQGDPNSATTFPYIPGSLIRGALIGRYLVQSNTNPDEFAVNLTARGLFLNGQVRYLPAHILINDKRSLPTPFSLYKEKADEDNFKAYHKGHPDFDEINGFDDLEQPKQLKATFGHLDEGVLTTHRPDTLISIHTQRERRAGRATENDGAVFRYEALAPGQTFAGVVLADDEQVVDQLEELLTGILMIGGSRSAGYGRVQVENVQRTPHWQETDSEPDTIDANMAFSVTFLSDAILRDKNGQYTDTLTSGLLAEALELAPESLHARQTFKLNSLVGGFNRKWGLPLPQTLAIQAGSVFCFEAKQIIPAERLKTLLWQGIGERRAEGFGRLAINWSAHDELTVQKYEEKPTWLKTPTLETKSSQKLAQQMSQRLLRRDADRFLNDSINKVEILQSGRPKKSQLGSVRIIIRQALQEKSTQPLVDYLNGMKSTAKKQFERGRVKVGSSRPEELLTWLQKRAVTPDQIWNEINFSGNKAKSIGPKAELTSKLAVEYTLRFVDGVLAKAAKEGSDNNNE